MKQSIFSPTDTIAACASATGGQSLIIRISGPQTQSFAQAAGLIIPPAWTFQAHTWSVGQSRIPCRILFAKAPKSFTGFDCLEITVPGSPIIAERCLQHLYQHRIQTATAGAFTRQALANKRIHLDQAEAILALSLAQDQDASAEALHKLRGALSNDIEPMRQRIIQLRAQVEAGLDFLDEEDVRAYEVDALIYTLKELRSIINTWQRAAVSIGENPSVCIVGPANAGKSALFHALTGQDVLISAQAGTTRDFLQHDWNCHGRSIRLIDTAGWLDQCEHALDQAGIDAGLALLRPAQLIIACSAADARLADNFRDIIPNKKIIVCACKADLGTIDERAQIAVSANERLGLDALQELIAEELGLSASGEPRQQRCLQAVDSILQSLEQGLPPDELLSDDLRQIADHLGDLIGITTTDDIMDVIFSRFCIGK